MHGLHNVLALASDRPGPTPSSTTVDYDRNNQIIITVSDGERYSGPNIPTNCTSDVGALHEALFGHWHAKRIQASRSPRHPRLRTCKGLYSDDRLWWASDTQPTSLRLQDLMHRRYLTKDDHGHSHGYSSNSADAHALLLLVSSADSSLTCFIRPHLHQLCPMDGRPFLLASGSTWRAIAVPT